MTQEEKWQAESTGARWERTVKRLITLVIISLVLLFASNAFWLYAWLQYDYTSEEAVYEQDGNGVNNINTGTQGDVNNGANANNPNADTH